MISLELNALCDFQFGWTKTFMCVQDSSPHVERISHSSLAFMQQLSSGPVMMQPPL